jgi:heat-inducible transcriptional repressor
MPAFQEGLDQAGRYLAEQTGMVALVYLPPKDRFPLDWVQLHNASRKQVLVAVHTLFGDLWSKLIPAASPFPDDLLAQVAQYINGGYRGQPLEHIRRDVMTGEPKEVLERMPSLGAAFRLLRRAFEWEEGPEGRCWGRDNLLYMPQAQDPQRLQFFHRILGDPALLSNAVANSHAVEGGWVSIGTETGYRGLEDCSIAGHAFGAAGWQGQIGVLGPMGMNYGLVLQLTAQAASALTSLLADLASTGAPSRD